MTPAGEKISENQDQHDFVDFKNEWILQRAKSIQNISDFSEDAQSDAVVSNSNTQPCFVAKYGTIWKKEVPATSRTKKHNN